MNLIDTVEDLSHGSPIKDPSQHKIFSEFVNSRLIECTYANGMVRFLYYSRDRYFEWRFNTTTKYLDRKVHTGYVYPREAQEFSIFASKFRWYLYEKLIQMGTDNGDDAWEKAVSGFNQLIDVMNKHIPTGVFAKGD